MNIHEFGKGNEQAILLIHPSVVRWDYFEHLIPLLKNKYHLIIPALPGYDSEDESDFTSIEKIAAELNEWLQAEEIAELYAVYGCSMGGSVALMVTLGQLIPIRHWRHYTISATMACHTLYRLERLSHDDAGQDRWSALA